MSRIKRRTFLIFNSRSKREAAIDFLLKLNVKFTANVKANKGLFYISIAPKIFVKHCLDLYLYKVYINCYSKIYN